MKKQLPTLSLTSLLKPQKLFVFGAFAMILLAVFAVLYLGRGLRALVDNGFDAGLLSSLAHLFGAVVLLSIASALRSFCVANLEEKTSSHLQKTLFHQMLHLRMALFLKEPHEHWQKMMNHDIAFITQTFTKNTPALIRNILLCLGGFGGLLLINVNLALILLGFLPLILLFLVLFLQTLKHQKNLFETAASAARSLLNERLKHLFFIRAASLGDKTFETLHTLLKNQSNKSKTYTARRAIFVGLTFLLTFGAVIGFLWIGATFVTKDMLSKGDLTSFLFYAVLMAISASSLSEHYHDIAKAKDLFKDLNQTLLLDQEQNPQTSAPLIKNARLVFQNVSFAYGQGLPHVLHNLSLTLSPFKKIALIGESGAGKSTLFKLLLGFYEPTAGNIFWGDAPLNALHLKDLRKTIAYVPQDPVIFEGTFYDNLTLWQPYDEKAIMHALEKARGSDILEKLPQGLQTLLGPSGITLSRGEQQRIALARIFLSQPSLLLLDEPTSSLDPMNEAYVTEALHTLMEGRTTLMITHRIETTKDFDEVWTLEKGKLKKRT